jgi:hypothetical protein
MREELDLLVKLWSKRTESFASLNSNPATMRTNEAIYHRNEGQAAENMPETCPGSKGIVDGLSAPDVGGFKRFCSVSEF